jgi:hypothetical protein
MHPLARVPFGILGLGLAGLLVLAADRAGGNGGPAELPFAQGQSFASLDDYLAHLQTLGTIGITWYRLLPDGRYEQVRRRPPGSTPLILTRQELLIRYGFAR